MRTAIAVIAVLLAGCAGSSKRPATCTLGTDAARADFAAEARSLGAKSTRDDLGLHVALASTDEGRLSSFANRLAARESVCCRFLKIRLEAMPGVTTLHILADKVHGSTLDEFQKLISDP